MRTVAVSFKHPHTMVQLASMQSCVLSVHTI